MSAHWHTSASAHQRTDEQRTDEQHADFETRLQENLALYCAPAHHRQDLFQAHREIALARYALTQQANAYYTAVVILTDMLEQQRDQAQRAAFVQQGTDTATRQNADVARIGQSIFTLIQSIELKSQKLIESAHKVTALLGEAVNIDVDKAALHSLLLRLPSLVHNTVSTITQDSQIADSVSQKLNSEIESMLVAVRFSDSLEQTHLRNGSEPLGITLEQYSQLLDSVPAQP